MFGKKKEAPKRRASGGKGLAQYGLFGMPGSVDEDDPSDESDGDLEAELAAITAGGGGRPKPRPKAKPDPMAVDLDAMVAASMRDIGSDEELSGDDDDPELLNELSEIAGEDEESRSPVPPQIIIPTSDASVSTTALIEERIKMYQMAEANAKAIGETGRARRFNRGLKTLNDMLKQSKAGQLISVDDIPPEVSVTVKEKPPAADENANATVETPEVVAPAVPSRPAPVPPRPEPQPELEEPKPVEDVDPRLPLLNARKEQYKVAALAYKKSGDNVRALKYIKICKQFDAVIAAVKEGHPVDLSNMPGPPGTESEKEESEKQTAGSPEAPSSSVPEPTPEPSEKAPTDGGSEETPVEPALITASSVMEALQQRLEVYKGQVEAATQGGNSSKARRMGRIVKQFEQAIKTHKSGRPIPFDELPTPPGYAPIPGSPEATAAAAPKPPPDQSVSASSSNVPEPSPAPRQPTSPEQAEGPAPKVPARTNSRKMATHVPTSVAEKQVALLIARQKEFKVAALAAKQKGEINEAKELLRTAKGFDNLIGAAMGGLPVDMTTLPIPNSARSQLEDSFAFVNLNDVAEDDSGSGDLLTRLEEQLTRQLKLCLSTRDHHRALGDVAGTNRFEHLALSVTKDLDVVKVAQRSGQPPPAFHYETKSFSVVQCCTELGDNDLEVTIVRGVNYTVPNPKDVDTYVKFEFPFPQDEPYMDRTPVVRNTNNPEYGVTFTIPIIRTNRHCLRTFKRHGIKFEVMSKGGLFRSDAVIGTANVKLQPLETKCILHESYDLLDGRKSTGGKLEVKLRVRNPMLTKQVEQITEKWLIIDH